MSRPYCRLGCSLGVTKDGAQTEKRWQHPQCIAFSNYIINSYVKSSFGSRTSPHHQRTWQLAVIQQIELTGRERVKLQEVDNFYRSTAFLQKICSLFWDFSCVEVVCREIHISLPDSLCHRHGFDSCICQWWDSWSFFRCTSLALVRVKSSGDFEVRFEIFNLLFFSGLLNKVYEEN